MSSLRGKVAIVGAADTPVGKVPQLSATALCAEAARLALEDAGIAKDQVDGLVTCNSMAEPYLYHAEALAEYLQIFPRYCVSANAGGGTTFSGIRQAAAAIATGACSTVVVALADTLRTGLSREQAMKLQRTPSSAVDYRVRFQNDLERIRLHNDFIAGESALVVGAQKWWEQVNPVFEIQSTDLSIAVPYPALSSWSVGGPISIVSQDALTVAQASVASITVGPDPYVEQVVVLASFDGADGQTTGITNEINGAEWTMLFGTQIDTAQSKFGGASLLCSTLNPGFSLGGAYLAYNPNMDAPTDMTLDLWFRPTATDLSASNVLASRWYSLDPGARSWLLRTPMIFRPAGWSPIRGITSACRRLTARSAWALTAPKLAAGWRR